MRITFHEPSVDPSSINRISIGSPSGRHASTISRCSVSRLSYSSKTEQ